MNRKFTWFVTPLFLVCLHLAEAQQPTKVPRIGYLTAANLSAIPHRIEAFRRGLRELGYIEGKNILIEYRSLQAKGEHVPNGAAELVRLKVDVIVTGGGGSTRPAKEATSTIPIVMAQDRDPVGNGFVASLAKPGGNITGLSTHFPEISGKQLEILKETVPNLSRVAVFGSSTNPGNAQASKQLELAARALGLKLQYIEIPRPIDIDSAFHAAGGWRADAGLMMVAGDLATSHRKKIAEAAVKNRLPTMYDQVRYAEAGGLMTYGVDLTDLDRRAATYVDKILKGAKPANLPVEQPTKFELVVNLKTAKQINLNIPPHVLARADRVLK
jgi:putative ABC transport system substrate-binding protein